MSEHKKQQLYHKLNKMADFLEKLTSVPCVVLGGAMACVVMSGVIARYIMRNPMPWTEEVARFLMIWVALLGVSIASRRRGHLGVLFFVQKLPLALQRLVKFFNDLLILLFLLILTFYGIKMVHEAKVQIEPSTGIIMSYPLLCVPLCGILTIIQLGIEMMIDALRWGTSKSPFEA